MGMLNDAMDWLSEVEDDTLANTVTYTRDGVSVSIPATVGRTPFRTDDIGTGANKIVRSDRDYLITAALLVLNGVAVTPRKGDQITDGGVTYEVRPIVATEPAWRYSDAEGVKYRVHCVRVA